jgi:hypothetical protein
MFAREPEHVGIEKKKENQADREKIHIEAEEDAGLKEIPSRTPHAAEGVDAADEGDTCGDDEEQICAVVRKAGEQIGGSKAGKDQSVASQERCPVRIEDAGSHA